MEIPSDIILQLEDGNESPSFTKNSSPLSKEAKSDSRSNESANFEWNNLMEKKSSDNASGQETEGSSESSNAENLLQNFLMEHQNRNQRESIPNLVSPFETEYVSLEKLAETVNTCRVCNEKFKDIAHLDAHKSKCSHYQCNIPECSSLMFSTPGEVAMHKAQVHGAPMSPSVSQLSPHHMNQNSPRMNQSSPHTSTGSPGQFPRNSPLPAPRQNHSPTFNNLVGNQQMMPPVANFDQLPAPVQQLAQQVQRMPLPQPQGNLPPGASTMIPPGANYYVSAPGRPPMYRMPGPPQPMHYPTHMGGHMYPPSYTQQPPPYPQMANVQQMHHQMPQMGRPRYSNMAQNVR